MAIKNDFGPFNNPKILNLLQVINNHNKRKIGQKLNIYKKNISL